MKQPTPASQFVELSIRHPVIDVRSPGEFARGHIPGAKNVALLSDFERAEVGIAYSRRGRESAISLGRQIVHPKLDQLIESFHAHAPTPDVLVHCWRGGMRSRAVAEVLANSGFRPRTLLGGYKAFRQLAHRSFSQPRRVVILSGLSGSGKTHLLHALDSEGKQVIDLEGLARHRGSAFGGIGQPAQPTVEQFENELFCQWRGLDPNRVVWIESESRKIGQVVIPEPIWHQMVDAPAINLQVSREERIQFLVDEYGHLPAEELQLAVLKIEKRLGGERCNRALEALRSGDLHRLADIVLDYYDRAYSGANEKCQRRHVTRIKMSQEARGGHLRDVLELAEALV